MAQIYIDGFEHYGNNPADKRSRGWEISQPSLLDRMIEPRQPPTVRFTSMDGSYFQCEIPEGETTMRVWRLGDKLMIGQFEVK